MATIAEVRAKYPQYKDMSDDELGQALHAKFYSDMPYADFAQKVGLKRFGTGKSFDVMADNSLQPSQDVVYNANDVLPASSIAGQKIKNGGSGGEFDFSVTPQDVQNVRKSLSPILRAPVNAVTSLPFMAADTGISLRNLATGSNYPLTTQYFEQMKDKYLPMPNVPGDKTLELGLSALAGAKLPAPQVDNPAPASFVKPNYDALRQASLKSSQDAGYVVPPATTNPTLMNKFLESFGGKIATAQDAAVRNQEVTNTLAKRAIGLTEDAPLSQGALSATRAEAGNAYATLRNVGSVPLDEATSSTLDNLASKFSGSKLKDVLGGGSDIPKIVQAIKDEPLTGSTAVDAIDLLRSKADVAFRSGDKYLGKGYKDLSSAIENLMENQLSGGDLQAFKDARQLIAKTHSVGSALNESTGNVAASKLAAQLAKGKPLSGDLKTIAQFGRAFPKAAQEINDSGAVRNTDVALGAVTSALSKEPSWLLYPFLRQGARSFLLSNAGQSLARQTPSNGLPPEVVMALIGAQPSAQ